MTQKRYEALTLLKVVLTCGLHMETSDLSDKEIERQAEACLSVLQHCTLAQAVQAVRWGMPTVWPFSEDNRSFDAVDLSRNLLKARAGAKAAWTRGEIPLDAQKAKP